MLSDIAQLFHQERAPCTVLAVRDRSFALDAVDVVPEVLQVLSRFDSVSESFSDRVAYDPRVSTHAIDARLFVASAAPLMISSNSSLRFFDSM